MASLLLRFLAGIVSSIVFPVILAIVFLFTLGGGEAGPLYFILFIAVFAAPVYLIAGIPVSLAIDGFAGALRLRSGPVPHLVKAPLYAAAGYIVFYFFIQSISGPPYGISSPTSTATLLIGSFAALLYYVILELLQKAAGLNRQHAAIAPPEPIVTERLRIMPCTPERLEEAKRQSYPVGNHVTWYLSHLKRDPEWIGWGTWLVQTLDTGRFVGDAGFKGKPDSGMCVEIGYGFLPEARGIGYGTETAKALVEWAFRQGVRQVIAETEKTNDASIHVLSKLGFTRYHETERFYYWQLYRRD
ncbi:GNAT family N-acetyltransferase [Paenibacillus thermotolerans]|uniref:GNAT family N-acetyltransferase n=1 Tax=Paenibacillus thermotolerans TaxID=3027807 RepID=UPI00236782EE|nr:MULTISPECIES: GNAT family N-acetyltransferase [unclassified Paenibacillus]